MQTADAPPPSSLRDEAYRRTVDARIEELTAEASDPASVARTLVEHPGETIRPFTRPIVRGSATGRGLEAVERLQALGASLHKKIELHRTLGEGGMGVVHLATQATVGRHVAVKTLRPGVSGPDATLRILREAWVTGALEHPNVVPIYDVGTDGAGAPVIVMKRIEGTSWADLLRTPGELARRFPSAAADPLDFHLGILESVCNAVHFAHSRGILHRDLKPENVMVGAFGEVYLLDWGIAVSLEADPTGRLPVAASFGEIAGTPHYMAPEMLLGDPSSLSPRTDVYLLGAVLYELFTGDPPHEGPDLSALMTSILLSRIEPPDDMPHEVAALSARAMHRDPAERPESAEAFRRGVADYRKHQGSRRLAAEAHESEQRLREAIGREAGEARTEEVARLLGECRFGYRAALSAWDENAEAKEGLDRALLAVVEHALATGDAKGAETLLREVKERPAATVARVEDAVATLAREEGRLRKLDADQDARIGSKTRMFVAGVLGVSWTGTPFVAREFERRFGDSAAFPALAPLLFLLVGSGLGRWARESLTKTELNRRLVRTCVTYLCGQAAFALVGWAAGVSEHVVWLGCIPMWALTFALLAVWADPWFWICSAVCTVSFAVAMFAPERLYHAMSLDNFTFTVVVVLLWHPDERLARIRERGRRIFTG